MKTLKFIFFIGIIIMESCGAGTHGKIKSYEYSISKNELESYIHAYFQKHPDLKKADDNKNYDLKGSGYESYMFNCCIRSKNEDFVYTVSYTGDSLAWANTKVSEIALIYAAKYGETSKTNSDLGFFEKKHLVKIFEDNFIKKLPIKSIASE